MANTLSNALQSSQTQATTAPDYYTNYLSGIASAGANQTGIDPTTGKFDPKLGAQFIGPQDLQNTAFKNVEKVASAYEPTLTDAGTTLTNAGKMASPLASANPYLTLAQNDPSVMAKGYMSPYMKSVIDSLSDVGQRNIQQNLAPSATASAVGSGQYGSQRGAQVLGQVTNNANRDLANQIAQTLNTGYNTALTTAQQQNQLEGQLGTTAANAQNAGQQNLTQLGNMQSNLAGQNQALGLADINALSTLGGQQQTIKQNEQLFPLTNLATLSSLLRGYNVPTSTSTTFQGSPLSALATGLTGGAGFFTADPKTGLTPYDSLVGGLKKAGTSFADIFGNNSNSQTAGSGTTTTGALTPSGLSVMADPASPSGYSDADGNPVNSNGTSYTG